MKTKDILRELELEQKKADQSKLNKRFFAENLDASDFAELMQKLCDLTLSLRNEDRSFDIDDDNKEVLNQLFYFLSQSKKFNGSFDKGILLIGSFGVGKSLIMRSFIKLVSLTTQKLIEEFHSKDIALKITEDPSFIEKWSRKPIYIDDIGKESKTLKNYGSDIYPITDLFSARYDSGAITFGTANHKLESLGEMYGGSISDRLRSMFNIIVLTGKSKRK